MKAAKITKYGPPEVLKIVDIQQPVPKKNQIRVKVHGSSVTAGDCRVRAFNVPKSYRLIARFALGWFRPRKSIPGMDMSGVVDAVGKDVKRFKPGDEIFGYATGDTSGTNTEYYCTRETGPIALKPENMSFREAGTVPVGAATALYFLEHAEIKKGDKVLIYGASGSVGTFAVQIAVHFGADVTAVCSERNRELVRSLGAGTVLDYNREDFTENGISYDAIFDAVGKTDIRKSLKSLKADGCYMHAVATPDVARKMKRESRGTRKKVVGAGPRKDPETLDRVKALIELGALRTIIDQTWPLAEITEAHRYVDTGRKRGNAAITIIDD